MSSIKEKAHYFHKSLKLLNNFVTNGYIHANLQVTRRCNFKCQICDFWKTEHSQAKELSLAEIEVISDKLSSFGTLAISLAGGEPVLREDLLSIIRILAKKHFPIMITNGWFINKENARALWSAGLQEISVSVDYADAAQHDTMRGCAGAFEKATTALQLLHDHRPSLRNRVHMISVLMDDNIEEIEKMILLAKELGVTYMVNLYSYQRGKKEERLPKEKVSEKLLSLKAKYPHFVSLTSYLRQIDEALENKGVSNCQAGRFYMNIDNYGQVSRCTETTDQPLANFLVDSPTQIKAKLLAAQQNSTCRHCWTSCRGWAESLHSAGRLQSWKEFYISVKEQN